MSHGNGTNYVTALDRVRFSLMIYAWSRLPNHAQLATPFDCPFGNLSSTNCRLFGTPIALIVDSENWLSAIANPKSRKTRSFHLQRPFI